MKFFLICVTLLALSSTLSAKAIFKSDIQEKESTRAEIETEVKDILKDAEITTVLERPIVKETTTIKPEETTTVKKVLETTTVFISEQEKELDEILKDVETATVIELPIVEIKETTTTTIKPEVIMEKTTTVKKVLETTTAVPVKKETTTTMMMTTTTTTTELPIMDTDFSGIMTLSHETITTFPFSTITGPHANYRYTLDQANGPKVFIYSGKKMNEEEARATLRKATRIAEEKMRQAEMIIAQAEKQREEAFAKAKESLKEAAEKFKASHAIFENMFEDMFDDSDFDFDKKKREMVEKVGKNERKNVEELDTIVGNFKRDAMRSQ